jgi:gamma-glutamyltranspeptidase/glutathione hydrolase
MMAKLISKTISAVVLFSCCIFFSALAQSYSKNGMVVSASKASSEVGRDILKKGGNAIDAAVATAFSLAVTWPSAGNIGGGGFIVFVNSKGEATTIDFREKAPLASSPTMYLDENGKLIDDINHLNIKAIGVPGTVAGLYKVHQKYGKLPWATVVQPAIDQAQNGFPFTWTLYAQAKNIKETWTAYPEMRRYMLRADENLYQPGELWKQPALAKTLSTIRDKGHDGFYKGEVASEIASFMKKNGGLITKKDLAKYEAIERTPARGNYKGYDIISMPPPSSGGVTLIQMMNMVENYDLSEIEFNSTTYIHLLAEVMRRGFADRAEHLGDPDFNPDMPVDQLISKSHAQMRSKNLDMTKASVSDSSRFSQIYDGESTTHLSVMDKEGNAVSMTYTLEYGYGSRVVDEKLGFIFNNEMGDFNPKPGHTNSKGLIGTVANQIAPEKRMLSSMTPTIVAKDGKPVLVIGSPGGRTIINTVFQTVLNVLEHGMRIDQAIEALKIHHQWLPDYILYEKWKLSPDTKKRLEEMGHTLREYNGLGALMGITYDVKEGVFTGAADSSRPDGGAVGY